MSGERQTRRARRGSAAVLLGLAAGVALAHLGTIPAAAEFASSASPAWAACSATPGAGSPLGLYYGGYAAGQALVAATDPGGKAGDAPAGAGRKRVSVAKSIGASLLMPGWGQHLAGRDGRARVFLATEAALIATIIGFRIQGEVRQERYIDYAEQFAGIVDASAKPDGYYRNLGRYASSADYEDDLMRDARALFGDDVAQREAYVDARRPPADEAWLWESTAHRGTFTEMRKESRNSFHRADQVIGVLILNHLLSAVDAARLSRRGSSDKALYLSTGPDGTSYVGLSWFLDE